MNFLLAGFAYIGIAIQVVLVICLVRSRYVRRYPLLFLLNVASLTTSMAEMFVWTHFGSRSVYYLYLYMADEAIIDLLVFLLVIRTTSNALEGNPFRSRIEKFLGLIAVAAVLLPFILYRGPVLNSHWLFETGQMLNFGAALMNLALWTALLSNKKRDPLLLAVSAGLGVAVTGSAVSFGLYHFRWISTGSPRHFVDLLKGLTNMASLIIWCVAFWPAGKPKPQLALPELLGQPRS